MSAARFHAGCLACVFAGLAVRATAQSDFLSPGGSSSTDTFGGNPDSYKFIRIPPDTGDWTRHFRIGAMVGFNISASFSEQGTFNIAGTIANGIFDDGYVRIRIKPATRRLDQQLGLQQFEPIQSGRQRRRRDD